MTLKDILDTKGDAVLTIGPDATLADVAQKLVEHNIGSLVVCRKDAQGNDALVGIITERDLLHSWAKGNEDLTAVQVKAIMTAELVTASPGDPVEKVMGLMTTKRIRHLPIISEGKLAGLVSIGDVVKAHLNHLAVENKFMKDYIQG